MAEPTVLALAALVATGARAARMLGGARVFPIGVTAFSPASAGPARARG